MYSLLHHNTFGIDAKCSYFKEYGSVEELLKLLPELEKNKWLQIGSGSNLLFVKDFDGYILHSRIEDCQILEKNSTSILLRVGSGYNWDEFVAYCVDNGYYGLENLSYIPGEVGASAVQNIGAYGVEVGQFIESVETIEVATGQSKVFTKAACHYAYRDSVFKKECRGKYIVTHVNYRLLLNFEPDLKYAAISRELAVRGIHPEAVNASLIRNLIIEIRRTKLPDPNEVGSAGSFFVNPIVSNEKYEQLLSIYPGMPHYQLPNGVKVPAGWLIEQCGWKGKALGKVGVYSKQALVLVNLGGATGQDVVDLSQAVRKSVYEKFGIEIHPEVNFIY